MTEPLSLRLEGIDKRFGAVRANRGASLDVAAGEIHALVGENGAGKSTLMRIVAGLLTPDAGTARLGARDVTGWRTSDAITAGVGMVHQHFMLVPTLTVAENVVLGLEPRRGAALDLARATAEVNEVAAKYGLRVDASRIVGELSVGEESPEESSHHQVENSALVSLQPVQLGRLARGHDGVVILDLAVVEETLAGPWLIGQERLRELCVFV